MAKRLKTPCVSLSARRAWIEIRSPGWCRCGRWVALRKESVDRNRSSGRKGLLNLSVALRKESVDRNLGSIKRLLRLYQSLSARRAWIEIKNIILIKILAQVALRKESVDRNFIRGSTKKSLWVALRKESVDRNLTKHCNIIYSGASLSARRAWIEIQFLTGGPSHDFRRSPQGERG